MRQAAVRFTVGLRRKSDLNSVVSLSETFYYCCTVVEDNLVKSEVTGADAHSVTSNNEGGKVVKMCVEYGCGGKLCSDPVNVLKVLKYRHRAAPGCYRRV